MSIKSHYDLILIFDILLWCCVSRNFYVVVVPLKRTSGTVKNLKNPDEMDMEEVGYFESKRCGAILALEIIRSVGCTGSTITKHI